MSGGWNLKMTKGKSHENVTGLRWSFFKEGFVMILYHRIIQKAEKTEEDVPLIENFYLKYQDPKS